MANPLFDHDILERQLTPLIAAPHWYVGYSGGMDSTVLLHSIKRWCEGRPDAPPLSAIHVNHGLQNAADDWQRHCEAVCQRLNVPLVCLRADVRAGSRGLEAAARDARYRLFGAQLLADEIVFLAHHADDQVETFFLRLLRGAGVQGLAAMPGERPLGCGRLSRPLLQLSRQQLEQYAQQRELQWVDDPSNADLNQDRNFLRGEVLPLLGERWPGYRQTVGRASEHIATAAEQLAGVVPTPGTVYSRMGDPGIALNYLGTALGTVVDSASEASLINSAGPSPGNSVPAPELALRHWLRARGLPMPDQAVLSEFLRQLMQLTGQSRPRLQCSAYVLQRYRDAVYLLPDAISAQAEEIPPVKPGQTTKLPGGQGSYQLEPTPQEGLLLDAADKLTLAWRQGGERCQPHGRRGSTSLKKLLQEYDVPPWWRERVPLLYLGDELLAVGDLWLCDSSRWRAAADPGESLYRPRWEPNISPAFD